MAIPLRQPAPTPILSRTRRSDAPARLTVVPRRRRVAWFAVTLVVLSSMAMMGAIYVHTRIAERQLTIDELERSVRQAQTDFDVLRAQRAELRSPTRLSVEATSLGMSPGDENDFVPVDPMLLAITIARTGEMPAGDELVAGSTARLEPLDQFRLVKSVSAEAP